MNTVLPAKGISVASYRKAVSVVEKHADEFPLMLKWRPKRGLGRGVIVCDSLKEARIALRQVRDGALFTKAHCHIVPVREFSA